MDMQQVNYWQARCLSAVRASGYEPDNVLMAVDDKGVIRMDVWIYECLHKGLEAVVAGDKKLAFRCYVQAHEYKGRFGAFWPSVIASDAASTLRACVEEMLE